MKKFFIILVFLYIGSMLFAQSYQSSKLKDEIRLQRQYPERWAPVDQGQDFISIKNENSFFSAKDFGDPPAWDWIGQFGGSGKDNARDILTDPDGNILVCGSFSGMIVVGDSVLYSQGDWDAFVAKFGSNGQLAWIKQFKASTGKKIEALGLNLTNTGTIYLTGYYQGTVTIGEFNLSTFYDFTVFLASMDASGNVIMAKDIPGYGYNSCGFSIETDNFGNLFILGSSVSTTDSYLNPTVFFKCDSSGNLTEYIDHSQNFCSMKIVGQYIYFAGTINQEGYIGPFYFDPVMYSDVFVAKSDLDFNFEWAYMAGHDTPGYSRGYDLFVSHDEFLYFTGYYMYNIVFGDDILIGAAKGFLAKCDPQGEFEYLVDLYPIMTSNVKMGFCGADNWVYAAYSYNTVSSPEMATGISVYNALTGEHYSSIQFDYSNMAMAFNPENDELSCFGQKDQLLLVSQLEYNLNEDWLVEFDGNSAFGDVYATTTDQLGNLYVYGYASNDLDYFGQDIGKGMFIAKHNQYGNLYWIRSLPESFFSFNTGNYLKADTVINRVYITGLFYAPLLIPGGPTLTPDMEGSIFVIGFDFDGGYEMSFQEDFPGKYLSVETDHNGNLLLNGTFNSEIPIGNTTLIPRGINDFFIAKYNPQGIFHWAIRAGGEGEEDYDYESFITADGSDNIYFAGESTGLIGSVDDDSVTMNQGDGNFLMGKITPSGEVIWVKVKGASPVGYNDEYGWPTALKSEPDGYFYMKGTHNDSVYFDDIVLTSKHSKYSKFIAKFDPEGNTLWANSINEVKNSSGYNQIDIDPQGNVYLGGVARDTLFFGNDYTYLNSGLSDLFVARYSSNGSIDWVKTMESTSTALNLCRSVAVSGATRAYVSGRFSNYLEFGNAGTLTSDNQHGFISFVGEPTWITVYDPGEANELFDLYPNPASSTTTLMFREKPAQPVNVTITDINGKVIRLFQFEKGQSEQRIDITNLSNGLYLVKCNTGEKFEVEKLLVK